MGRATRAVGEGARVGEGGGGVGDGTAVGVGGTGVGGDVAVGTAVADGAGVAVGGAVGDGVRVADGSGEGDAAVVPVAVGCTGYAAIGEGTTVVEVADNDGRAPVSDSTDEVVEVVVVRLRRAASGATVAATVSGPLLARETSTTAPRLSTNRSRTTTPTTAPIRTVRDSPGGDISSCLHAAQR